MPAADLVELPLKEVPSLRDTFGCITATKALPASMPAGIGHRKPWIASTTTSSAGTSPARARLPNPRCQKSVRHRPRRAVDPDALDLGEARGGHVVGGGRRVDDR
jgi:hypothetical protein